jgi:hypothetical protein
MYPIDAVKVSLMRPQFERVLLADFLTDAHANHQPDASGHVLECDQCHLSYRLDRGCGYSLERHLERGSRRWCVPYTSAAHFSSTKILTEA